jgi:hypothetical protein
MGLTVIKFKASHQDIQDKGRMNPQNSLVIKIIVLNLIGGWNFL